MTKTISTETNNKLSQQNNLYLLPRVSVESSIESGSTIIPLTQSNIPSYSSTMTTTKDMLFVSQTKPHKKDSKHSLIAQQRNNERELHSHGTSDSSKTSSDSNSGNSESSSSSRIINSTMMNVSRANILPTPVAIVAGPSFDNEKDQSDEIEIDHNSLDNLFKEPMYFGTENSTTITTQVGANAHLPCVVHHIGDGVVSFFFYIKFNSLHFHE